MYFKLNRMSVLLLIALFSLFISNTSFADSNQDLLVAIGENNIDRAREILQYGEVNFQKMDWLRSDKLPSREMSELLLENQYNKLGLERFLGLIVGYNYLEYRKEEDAQKELVILALQKGVNPNILLDIAIERGWKSTPQTRVGCHLSDSLAEYYMLLALSEGAKFSNIEIGPNAYPCATLKLIGIMLDNHFDPNKMIEMALAEPFSTYASGLESRLSKRKAVINLALDMKADPNVLLEMAVNKCHFTERVTHILYIDKKEQDELIKMALARGAKFSAIRIVVYYGSISNPYEGREEVVKYAISEGAIYFDPGEEERKKWEEQWGKLEQDQCCSTCVIL